jgi:hypothetical protein
MPYPVAQGEPSYSGTYIPEVWSSKMLIKFYEGTVLTEVTNTDYEGEITDYGDKVQIRTVPDITINDYEKGQNLAVQRPTSANITLLIDKGKYFNFECKDLDKKQSDLPFVNKWAEDASNQMKIAIETDVFGDVYADAAAGNKGATAGVKSSSYNMGVTGTPLVVTKENAVDILVDAGSCLSEYDVPETDRFVIIPVWYYNLLEKSDLKDASMTGDDVSPLRNGLVGMISGMKCYKSNLLDTTTDGAYSVYNIMVGHITAITFATQLTKSEVIRNQNDFGDLTRSLQVFGYKVIKPESLVHVYARKG